MNHKLLFILIEGNDDERFFDKIIKREFEEKYGSVVLWKYRQEKSKKVDSFLKSIEAMGADYVYVADINRAPCVTGRKQEIHDKLKNIDEDRVLVVIREIEGWYLAGLEATDYKRLELPSCDSADSVSKEQFNGLIPKKFDSRIDFMLEILKCFSVETAKQKNRSFGYFLEKHNCEVQEPYHLQ